MRIPPEKMAIGLVLLLFAGASALARFYERSRIGDPPVWVVKGGGRFCVRVIHPDIRPGLVCGAGTGEVIGAAISRLGLPRACGAVRIPPALRSGDYINFDGSGSRCAIGGLGRLGGAEGLLAGRGLDINREPVGDLMLLPGIGRAKATGIVNSRVEQGRFSGPEAIIRVHGIGQTTAAKLAPWIEMQAAP